MPSAWTARRGDRCEKKRKCSGGFYWQGWWIKLWMDSLANLNSSLLSECCLITHSHCELDTGFNSIISTMIALVDFPKLLHQPWMQISLISRSQFSSTQSISMLACTHISLDISRRPLLLHVSFSSLWLMLFGHAWLHTLRHIRKAEKRNRLCKRKRENHRNRK